MNRRIRQATLLLAVFMALTYLGYRGLFTLNLTGWYATTASLLLYLAECYGCLLMFMYFFQIWDTTEPPPVPIIEGRTVDVFIPTYNEDVHLLRGTIEAAKRMDYPHNTWVLDDGRRPHVKALCEELGVGWIIRDNNLHAKAGNMNHALDITSGEFIIVFDADHVATRNFITRIIGYFADDRLAFIQTPHSYYNFDNYQATVDFHKGFYWEEGQIFYNVIQPGKNYWNAVSFCGSAAMFRRSALAEVGMVATETITEDMHTGLRMHAKGWRSLFVNERLTLGQAAPDISIFGPQRLRWGEGNLSVMAFDNPFQTEGLTWSQKINYIGSMLCWTTGIPKLLLYVTPILMLFTGVAPLQDFAWTYGAVTIGYLISTWLAVKIAGNGYGNLWEIEFTAMAYFWTQVVSTYRAVLKRKSAKFVVTNKRGGGAKKSSLTFVYPQLAIIFFSMLALIWAGLKLVYGLSNDVFGFLLGGGLVFAHVILALAVIRRALSPKCQRFSFRHPCNTIHVDYAYTTPEGKEVRGQGISIDVNERGVGFMAFQPIPVDVRMKIKLTGGPFEVEFDGDVKLSKDDGSMQFAREGKAVIHRIGVQAVDLQTDQIRKLWDMAIFYACERSYAEFARRKVENARWFNWLRKKPEAPMHLPARLAPTAGGEEKVQVPADLSLWTAGCTERITSTEMTVTLGSRLEDGKLMAFNVDTPFGAMIGEAKVLRSRAVPLALETLYEHDLEFGRFQGTSRGRLLSLTGVKEAPVIRNVVEHIPNRLPTPWLQPLWVSFGPVAAAACLMLGVFLWKNSDYILLTRINNGVLVTEATAQRVDGILEKVLAQRTFAGADQVVLLRRALLIMGRQEDAAKLAGILVDLAPGDVYARAAWADHLAKYGKHKEAEAQIQLLLKDVVGFQIDPQVRKQILLSAARSSVHLNNTEVAIERFNRYFELAKDDREAKVEFAGVLVEAKKYDEALDVLESVPLDRAGKLMLISVHSAQQQFGAARKVCKEILDEFPKDQQVMRLSANLALWDKDYASAIEQLRQLRGLLPNDMELELHLARAYLWDKQFEKAMRMFEPLARRLDDRTDVWEDYIRTAANMKHLTPEQGVLLDTAVRKLTAAAQDRPELWTDLAEAYFRLGESRRSVDLLETVVSQYPDQQRARLRLADLLHDMGEFKRADMHYKVLLSETAARNVVEGVPLPEGTVRTKGGPLRATPRNPDTQPIR